MTLLSNISLNLLPSAQDNSQNMPSLSLTAGFAIKFFKLLFTKGYLGDRKPLPLRW